MVVKEIPTIIFFLNEEQCDWIIKIQLINNYAKISFNHEKYPNFLPNDFAKAFGEILCKEGFLDYLYKERNY